MAEASSPSVVLAERPISRGLSLRAPLRDRGHGSGLGHREYGVGGVPELLQDGKEGLIVQPGHCEQLSRAMIALLKDADLRRKMGAAAAVRAKEKFGVSAMVRAYEELYDEISVPSRTWGHFHFGRKPTATREDLGA